MDTLLQLLFSSLETGSVYALASLGIILIFKTSRTVNFALGTISMFNAFVATFVLMGMDMPAWIAALIGMLMAFITGVLVDLVVMRNTGKVNAAGKEIITFGLIMLFLGIAPLIFGSAPLNFPKFVEKGAVEMAGASISYNAIINIIVGFVLMLALFIFLQKSKWGLAVRVTASSERTAKLMGVPTSLVTMGSWAIAAALGTLAALMLAPAITVNLTMMDNVQANALVACVLGGFQTFYGPVIGAYIIGFGRNLLLYYVSSTWGDPLLFTIILLFIVLRPNGIVGKKFVKKV